ncbi:MAG: hypothetical protein H6865_05315 [Rhodospirillales bacterium]|nr:hypothetical protein [Alphaproteobacteria bacterium]MCB9987038.1 hypothetical protein [Rhodospirillales bacterium]USO08193.1 MAG: hypothetical protein H6866_02975 [Rhodospirillales bacterium]
MALNDVALCSRALMRIGCAPIASFDDGTAESEIAGALYAPARDALLSAYGWSFATGQQALTRLTAAPEADYQYAYALPSDFLRALSAGTGARGRGLDYRVIRNVLHTDAESVLLTYIFLPDESEFPPFFDAALIVRLAAEFCIPLTESTSRAEALYSMAESEFRKAKQIDAQQDTPSRIENFPLVDVRG